MSKIIEVLQSLEEPKSCYGAVDISDIRNAESQLGLLFAEEYTEYVSFIGALAYNGNEFTGVVPITHLNVVTETETLRKNDPSFPRKMYVVSNLHIDGIRIVQNHRGAIFMYHPRQLVRFINDSLSDYILSQA